jgi:hypothetical protein
LNRKALFFVFAVGVLILLLWFTRKIPYCGWDFHNSLWGPVNMLINYQTPYTFDTPYGPYPGVWMPTTLGMFFLFGYISCDIASKLWLLAELAGFVWVIWMIADYKMPSRWVFFICVFVLFFFPPLWLHIRLGQFSMLFVVLMVVGIYLPMAERFLPLLLVLGLTKPQLAILVFPGLLIYVWRKKGFRQVVKLVLVTGICAGLLTVPLFLYYPGWVNDFLFVTFDNLGVGWDLPTLFVQLPFLLGNAGYAVWGLTLLAAMGISFWFWYHKDAKIALIISLAATPMVTPYASSWDFLLLMPGFFWLIIKLKSKAARVALLLGMAIIIVVQIAQLWRQDYPDGRQWWIPPLMILIYLISLLIEYSIVKITKTQLLQKAAP